MLRSGCCKFAKELLQLSYTLLGVQFVQLLKQGGSWNEALTGRMYVKLKLL